jgi:sugar O-acyltransferase (sialic acid O-acetyltransferase NeuD family)
MTKWIIFGFGNYISDIIDIIHSQGDTVKAVINNYQASGDDLKKLHERLSRLPYDIPVSAISAFRPSPDENYLYGFQKGRGPVIKDIEAKYNISFSTAVHSSVHLGSGVRTGKGVCIGPGTVIAPNVNIHDYCSINRSCSIGHDTTVLECATINPGVSIASSVTAGEGSLIGIGGVIIEGITIGRNSVVGAGAVVVRDVPDNVVVVGVPAKILRQND